MQNTITRIEIKKKIPYGYGRIIAKKAGVTEQFVSKYLNNSEVKSKRVEMATVEVLEEIKQNENAFNTRLQAAIS